MTEEPKQYRAKLPDYRKRIPGGGLSRFQSIEPHMNRDKATLSASNKAIVGMTTIFQKSIRSAADSPRLLVSGANNGKLGGRITKGPWKGCRLYQLTLVERETCPADCHLLRECFGNTMMLARRHRYDEALIPRLAEEIENLLMAWEPGIAVRLHTLGDFPDTEYVRAWLGWIKQHPQLRVFGYTARKPDSDIGKLIQTGNAYFPHRWAIRFSVPPEAAHASRQATTVWSREAGAAMERAIVCPAQEAHPSRAGSHRTQACGTCGLCWHPSAASRRIVFLGHGMTRSDRIGRPLGAKDTKPRPKRVDAGQPNPRNRRQKTAVTTLSREDIAQIRRAIDGGITASVIAAQWCISIATIHRLAEIA